jgi:hypothetical protein
MAAAGTAISGIMSIGGAVKDDFDKREAEKKIKWAYRKQREQVKVLGGYKIDQHNREVAKLMGKQEAAMAITGMDMNSKSFNDVYADSVFSAEMDKKLLQMGIKMDMADITSKIKTVGSTGTSGNTWATIGQSVGSTMSAYQRANSAKSSPPPNSNQPSTGQP